RSLDRPVKAQVCVALGKSDSWLSRWRHLHLDHSWTTRGSRLLLPLVQRYLRQFSIARSRPDSGRTREQNRVATEGGWSQFSDVFRVADSGRVGHVTVTANEGLGPFLQRDAPGLGSRRSGPGRIAPHEATDLPLRLSRTRTARWRHLCLGTRTHS